MEIQVTFDSADLKQANKNLSRALRNKDVLAQIVAILTQMGFDIDIQSSKKPRSPNGAATGAPHADHPPQTRRTRR